MLGVAAKYHDHGHGDEDRGEKDEDAGFDALERPVAAGGLVGDEPAEAVERGTAGWRDVRTALDHRRAGAREEATRYAEGRGPVRLRDQLAARAADAPG